MQTTLQKALSIARACEHPRRERVAGGAKWCPDCGAYFPPRGSVVDVRHPSWVTLVAIADSLLEGDL